MNDLIKIDKKYPECTGIDTVAWLNHVVGDHHDDWLAFLEKLNEQHNEDLRANTSPDFLHYFCERSPYTNRWISQLQEEIGMYLRAKTGQVYVPAHVIDNVYNHEISFSTVFQYQVWVKEEDAQRHHKTGEWYCDEFYYRDDVFVVTELHSGCGDVRANYGVPEIRGPVDSLCDARFLDWMIGWYITTSDGENADEDGVYSTGYSQNPTYHLTEALKGGAMRWSERYQCFVGWLNGRAVKMQPTCEAECN